VRVSVCWAYKSALRKEVEQIEKPFDGIDSRRPKEPRTVAALGEYDGMIIRAAAATLD